MTAMMQGSKRSSLKQTMRLLYIQMLQYMSINETIYSKDKKKKRGLLLLFAAYIFTGLLFTSYMAGGAYALCVIGAAEAVPAYVLSLTSIIILVFSMLKAGSILFQVRNYEMLIALPIKPTVIVVSRLLNMYIGNLLLSALTMIPACILYGMFVNVGAAFYIMIVISIFLLPLVPLTIASIIGAVITAIGARTRRKNAVITIISMLLVTGTLVISFLPLFVSDQISIQQIADLAEMAKEQVNGMYPLSGLFTEAVVGGNAAAFAGFAGISIGVFALFTIVVQRKYAAICRALISHVAKKNYKLGKQSAGKPFGALYKKEWKRYLSSSIYVMNTSVGYVMMVGGAIAILLLGIERIGELFMLKNAAEQAERVLPILFAMMGMLGSTTPASISMEGRQWWLPKSLPIQTKQIFDSKILVSLTLALPSCAVTAVICTFALRLSGLGILWMFLVPAAYCIFSSVMGIALNMKFPNFSWDNETKAVKQGAALLLSMLIEFACGFAGLGMLLLERQLSYNLIMALIVLLLFTAAAVIYKKIINYDLRKLN